MELRFDTSRLFDGGQSVIVCAINYRSEQSVEVTHPRIASYALRRDYHKVIKKRLKALLKALKDQYPTIEGRPFCDSAPLLEKQLAQSAGLGWIGRQSLLVTPQFGSYVLLGELIVNMPCDSYDTPYTESGCKGCRSCIDRCPVGAINDNLTIDTRRCISSRTVEIAHDTSELTLSNWIFGCDECQICCPHNANKPLHSLTDFDSVITPPSKEEWLKMDDTEFQNLAVGTPLKRSSLGRIQRIIKKEL